MRTCNSAQWLRFSRWEGVDLGHAERHGLHRGPGEPKLRIPVAVRVFGSSRYRGPQRHHERYADDQQFLLSGSVGVTPVSSRENSLTTNLACSRGTHWRWPPALMACVWLLGACRSPTRNASENRDGAGPAAPSAIASVPESTQDAAAPSRVIQVQAAGEHTLALRSDGKLFGWGANTFGVLGPDKSADVWPRPRKIDGLPRIKQVSSSAWHACAVDESGGVLCWGRGFGGSLGNGSMKDQTFVAPVRVQELTNAAGVVTASAVGLGCRSCAHLADGQVYCWGAWGPGAYAKPRLIPELGHATEVVIASFTACALQTSQDVACWGLVLGLPFENKIGYPNGNLRRLPKAAKLAVGPWHACVASVTGEVHCWGGEEYAKTKVNFEDPQLGRVPPARRVAGLTEIADLAVSDERTCVARSDGRVICWTRHDQFGSDPVPPVQLQEIAGLSDATTVALGSQHGCILDRSGRVFCWGDNHRRQLGTDSPESDPREVRIE